MSHCKLILCHTWYERMMAYLNCLSQKLWRKKLAFLKWAMLGCWYFLFHWERRGLFCAFSSKLKYPIV